MVIAIVLLTFVGNSMGILALVMIVSGWVITYRIIRAQARVIAVQSYIDAARLSGANIWDITVRHLLPGVLPIAVVAITINAATILIALSGLNYLGLGIQPPNPDWGNMVASGQARLRNAPWIAMFPGTILVLTILAIQNLGDAISDWFGNVEVEAPR
jgi:peptide/nickel transport system permease protein